MFERLHELFTALHSWLFESALQPLLFSWDLMAWAELVYDWSELFLLGAVEVILLWAVLRPLERWFPVEHWDDHTSERVDVVYTLLARLGVLPIFFFVALQPAFDWINANLRMNGIIPPNLEDIFPALQNQPLLSALGYLVIFDFVDYWRHRGQHAFGRWWALHSVHHSQTQMTFWTDEREHFLDQAIAAALRALVGLAIGVPPVHFLTVTLLAGAIESLSHANVRLSFGRLGDRLVVSPLYHRTHHSLHQKEGRNLASVLPLWDILFGTADFNRTFHPTGIEDQRSGRDYGSGFWEQQWLGLKRLVQ